MSVVLRCCANCRYAKVTKYKQPCAKCLKKGGHVNWEPIVQKGE